MKSFAEKTLDNDAIDFIFVIEKEDAEQFDKITSLYNNKLHIKTIYFDDVLKHFHIKYTHDELLAKYGRFTYQTFKKMYSIFITITSVFSKKGKRKINSVAEPFPMYDIFCIKNPFVITKKAHAMRANKKTADEYTLLI